MKAACVECLRRVRKKLQERRVHCDHELENGNNLANVQFLQGWVEALEWAEKQLTEVSSAVQSGS